jgi:hypothetical protein
LSSLILTITTPPPPNLNLWCAPYYTLFLSLMMLSYCLL